MDCLSTILRKELVQHLQTVFRGVSPQDGAERLDRLRALAVVGPGGDVRYVRAQALDDLVRVLELLGREVAVVEDPFHQSPNPTVSSSKMASFLCLKVTIKLGICLSLPA